MLFVRSSEYPKNSFFKKTWNFGTKLEVSWLKPGMLTSNRFRFSCTHWFTTNIIMNIYENISCLKRRLSSSKYLIYYCLLCWYEKIWKICNLQLLGWWGGGCWWPCLFQVLTLTFSEKENQNRKALGTCFTNLTCSPQKKTSESISLDDLPSKCWCHSLKRRCLNE